MAMSEGRLELSALGVDPRQIRAGHHRGQPNQPVTVATEVAPQTLDGLAKQIERGFVVAREVTCGALVERAADRDGQISQRLADRPGLLAEVASLVRASGHVEDMVGATMRGFLVFSFAPRFGEAISQLASWAAAGQIRTRVDIIEGLDRAPEALRRLFTGENIGKQLVQIADAP